MGRLEGIEPPSLRSKRRALIRWTIGAHIIWWTDNAKLITNFLDFLFRRHTLDRKLILTLALASGAAIA